jgi:predicted DNA-binding protein
MANLRIPEELDTVLQSAAERAGRTKDELAQEILAAHLEDESLPLSAFTDRQLARLKESIEQVRRGDVVPGAVVMSKLSSLIEDLEARDVKAS